ncbi:MAG TPA: alpha/beta hydrolase [Ktedonobacterales bacterium]|jgi:pimeloyl-ACP methyl ester carboxylesterase|nr:alpha/beta hydrolase [Ktedonobacterales bacterium]
MAQRRRLAGWQIATLSAAGVAGALAAMNALARAGLRPPEQALRGVDALYPWSEGTIHYTVRGRGEPMLLLHDLFPGSSSFEYRNVFAALADHYRVFAPDLLGYGLSGRPSARYSPQLYVTLIEDLLRQALGATDQPAHVIASGRSAPLATLAAAARPHLIRSLTLIEPVGLLAPVAEADAAAPQMARALLRMPLIGESVYNALVSRAGLRRALRRKLADGAASGGRVSDDVIDHYYAMAHQRGARFAPADLLGAAPSAEASAAFADLTTPTLLIWGQRDPQRPVSEGRTLRQAHPSAQLRIFPTGAMPHVEAPDAFAQEVFGWLRVAVRV